MFSTLRTRFGIPGVISVVALVFAMLGGAYAASNSGDGKGATASAKKSLKGPRGPRGPKGATGAAGPAGPAGPQGPAGANGKDGANGTNGTNGADGADGNTVLSGFGAPNNALDGENGDFYIDTAGPTIYGPKENGVWPTPGTNLKGTDGEKGEPWTAGGTLPSGASLTGTYATGRGSTTTDLIMPISFSLPLAAGLSGTGCIGVAAPAPTCKVHFINQAGQEVFIDNTFSPATTAPNDCGSGIGAGVNVENPQANPGHLCVYAAKGKAGFGAGNVGVPAIEKLGTEEGFASSPGTSTAGARLVFFGGAGGSLTEAWGTWAVTAP